MSRRTQIYVFVALLLVLAYSLYSALQNSTANSPGVVAANGKFEPLTIHEPRLRLDLLAKLQKLEYSGSHRNIFVETPPPPPPSAAQAAAVAAARRILGPVPPPPPPSVQVPAEFFGYETNPASGKHIAFFLSGDDVLVVPEGDSFLNRFRLIHIGTDSADVQEISSGRHAFVQLVQPPSEAPAQ